MPGMASPQSAAGSQSQSRARGLVFSHLLLFPLSLMQEGQLSVSGESIY